MAHNFNFKRNYQPVLPLMGTAQILMAMDIYHAPDWLWGVVLCLLAILWIAVIVSLASAETIDLFDKDDREKFIDGKFDKKD